ncbi:MAG: cryptochrome/photolyase family protein [Gemmatimonadales bacterium]
MTLPTWFIGPWELSRATAHLPPDPRAGRILLIESTDKGRALPWHRWKLVLVLSALRHFVEELRAEGYEVDHRVATSYAEGIRAHIAEYGPSEVLVQEPAEWGIGESIRSAFRPEGLPRAGSRSALPKALGRVPGSAKLSSRDSAAGVDPSSVVRILPDRRFITSRDAFYRWAEGRKLFRMEDFYRWQRKRLGILVDGDGKPQGGTWNLDKENRQGARALAKHGLPPEPIAFEPDEITRRVMRLVTRMGTAEYRVEGSRAEGGKAADRQGGPTGPSEANGHWGSVDGFNLPVTRAQALAALDDFLTHRFRDFGPYEDAMLAGKTYLYHSRLSAAMNVGLLHPREMIDAAIRCWEESQAAGRKALGAESPIPYASLEGFVRQILGWREYINGIYWLNIPEYRDSNYFGFERPLWQLYWEPEQTDLACLRDSVTMVRDTAYAHHIHRLMVLSNFANLTGVNPLRLSEWFWAGFADAMEWVELPNVVGMATFGDGGLLASKPYISAAAYIDRMSNYCGGCRYNPKARTGENACPFNYLYWTFLDHVARKKFDVGQRMALALKLAADIPAEEMKAMRAARKQFIESLEPDATGWRFHYDQG